MPNGNAKVWLYGCMNYTYVGEIEPSETIISKKKFSDKHPLIKYNEKQIGHKAEPIPWDKVDKVYYPIKRMKMDRLDDWEPEK